MNNEEISALMDGEVGADEFAPLIDSVSGDVNARRSWARYHLIGDALRAEESSSSTHSAQVVELIPERPRSRVFSPLTGLAIAASVAVLAVTFVLQSDPSPGTTGFEVAEQLSPRPLAPAAVSSLAVAPARDVIPAGAYDQRLNGYLVNFNEQRARVGVPGVHPYVRIIGFEAE